MKLTKKQRAQTVKVLQYAAELVTEGQPFARLEAVRRLKADRVVQLASEAAANAVPGPRTNLLLLEAARRVDEGQLP